MPPVQTLGLKLRLVLLAIAALAIALPTAIVATAKPILHHRPRAVAVRVVPQAELPPVEPVEFQSLSPEEARAFNATVPFSADPNPAARPFRLEGDDAERARATDCMAAAVLYEAGDDTLGQRAVAQVVINRVRHPAFPKTICGVVFQGSERTTGCQFTFTCDGALVNHQWSDEAWKRARETATLALTGTVFKVVGHSTHYHTDWVVPYWQSSLDKVAAVHSHLFFRWTGWWGTPPAFRRQVSSDEPVIAALAAYSDAHKPAGTLVQADPAIAAPAMAAAAAAAPGAPAADAMTEATASDGTNAADTFLIQMDPHLGPQGFAQLAARTCGERPYCKFMGWSDPRTKAPTSLPLTPISQALMSFSYLRDRAHGFEKALVNCTQYPHSEPMPCMKLPTFGQKPRMTGTMQAPAPAATPSLKTADGLPGVRRRTDTAAAVPAASTPSALQ